MTPPSAARLSPESGIVRPYGPQTLAGMVGTLHKWGTTPAGGFKTLALRQPDGVAIIDELGEVTFGELHRRTNALAQALKKRGVREGDGIAVMCRNHRGFIETSIAVSKLGADVLFLNTAFAGPQLADVLEREAPRIVVHDEEFTGLLEGIDIADRVIGWTDGEASDDTIEGLIGRPDRPPNSNRRSTRRARSS